MTSDLDCCAPKDICALLVSRKVLSEWSRKSPAIMPNSEHAKPLKARQRNEIFYVQF